MGPSRAVHRNDIDIVIAAAQRDFLEACFQDLEVGEAGALHQVLGRCKFQFDAECVYVSIRLF